MSSSLGFLTEEHPSASEEFNQCPDESVDRFEGDLDLYLLGLQEVKDSCFDLPLTSVFLSDSASLLTCSQSLMEVYAEAQ